MKKPSVPKLMTRRNFLAVGGAATGYMLSGCATNPVTGKSQFMLMTRDGEIAIDQQHAPHQFSSDFGVVQDESLNTYIEEVGLSMAALTHRPDMPYSFQAVNSPVFNAYAFPGGTIATTRGILLGMEDEAELAAVLGHELGHVNARHSASRMSSGMLAQLIVLGATAYVEAEYEEYAPLAATLGGIGAGALLARYSRQNERQADELGMEYMVNAGYDPNGMVGLMDAMREAHDHKPSIIEMMFASHPMTDERYDTAAERVKTRYSQSTSLPRNRERYMDNTAELRKIKGAVLALQDGNSAMMSKRFQEAYGHYKEALRIAPNDYAALLLMANCCQTLERPIEAKRYIEVAKGTYPTEAQAWHHSAMLNMQAGNYGSAHENLQRYKQLLPGNPVTDFYDGFALQKMGRKDASAQAYAQYLQQVQQGDQAQYAYNALVEWGYIKPQPQQ